MNAPVFNNREQPEKMNKDEPLRNAAHMALEALDIACRKYGEIGGDNTDWEQWDAAMAALRAALEQLREEHDEDQGVIAVWRGRCERLEVEVERLRKQAEQAQQAQPVAWRLTNTAFRTPRYEYYDTREHAEARERAFNMSVDDGGLYHLTPLFAAPPSAQPAVPLTDEQVRDLWSRSATAEAERTATTQQHAFARAIERAHGIGKEGEA